MNAQQKIDSKEIATMIDTLIYTHAQLTQVSIDQKGLKPNQIRLYRDRSNERDYFIVTVTPEEN